MDWFSIVRNVADILFILWVIISITSLNRSVNKLVLFLNALEENLNAESPTKEIFRVRSKKMNTEITIADARAIIRKRKKLEFDEDVVIHEFELKPYGFVATWSINMENFQPNRKF